MIGRASERWCVPAIGHDRGAVRPDPIGARIATCPAVGPCSVWSTSLELTVRLPNPSSRRVEVIVTTGTIKKIVSDRGFGFITGEDGKV
jgi:hypothetical protein